MRLRLREILDSPVNGTTKGIPADARILLGEVGDQGWQVLAGDTPFPVALLKRSAIEHNIDWMRRFAELTGVELSPHGKTSMSPQLLDRQLAAGAWGLTAATITHLQVYRRFGVQRILFANQLVDPAGLRFVLGELERDPEFDFYCLVDSHATVRILRDAVAASGMERPLQVLVEMGHPGGRTGARTVEAALEIARAVHGAAPHLLLRGVEGFEGVLEGTRQETTLTRIGRLLDDMATVTDRCADLELFGPGPIVVSAGGSQYYDLTTSLSSRLTTRREAVFVLRSGCYVTHDSSWFTKYAKAIAERMPQVADLGEGLRSALEVWAHVQSLPEPGLAIVSLGKRDASFDVHLPTPLARHRRGDQAPVPLSGYRVLRMNDHHTYLELPRESELAVGDSLGFGIGHPCTTFDRWPVLLEVDDAYQVVGAVRTFF